MIKKLLYFALLCFTLFCFAQIQLVRASDSFLFNKTLRPGMNYAPDVSELQKFLNSNNFVVSQFGAGSMGHETNYFGYKTKAATLLFQKANNLDADSIVGPKTRAVINEIVQKMAVPVVEEYSIGGKVSGLFRSITLQNNNGDDLVLDPGTTSFTFSKKLLNNDKYSVLISKKHSGQKCSLVNNHGIVNGSNVTNIKISCSKISRGGSSNRNVEITSFDAISDIDGGVVGLPTYANAAAVIAALNISNATATANSGAVTVPVTNWVDTDTYNAAAAGSYTFTATLGAIPSGFLNTGGFTATVEVVVALPASCGTGSGALNDPIVVCTASQLNAVRDNLGLNYIQGLDIDLNVSPYNSDPGWDPIGDDTNKFTGAYDGAGYTISNLTINRSLEDNIGLFGYNEGGTIINVYLENVNVIGKESVGALVGTNNIGDIYYSYSTGSVNGSNGGIGGLIGKNGGTISNSYSSSNVVDGWSEGGLVGGSWGSILNSYSFGNVQGGGDIGGLLGSLWGGSVSNSFYDKNTSGQSDTGKGDGQETIWMKKASNFVGWDFTNIWTTNGDTTYPNFIAPVYIQITPSFNIGSGAIVPGSKVTITSIGADNIYYTLDGSDPDPAISPLYTGPVQINGALTLKALATRTGYSNSLIQSAIYTSGDMCIAGDATPNGWWPDTNMTHISGTSWGVDVSLLVGEMKFKVCGGWNNNFGGVDFPSGTGTQDGPNISVVKAGGYYIIIDASTGNYNFYAPTPSVINLAEGSVNPPIGGVTNVAIPIPGAMDNTGLVIDWITGIRDTIKFTVTDSGAATSIITIGGIVYASGTDYIIPSTDSLEIVVTTSEAGKADAVRAFVVDVIASP